MAKFWLTHVLICFIDTRAKSVRMDSGVAGLRGAPKEASKLVKPPIAALTLQLTPDGDSWCGQV